MFGYIANTVSGILPDADESNRRDSHGDELDRKDSKGEELHRNESDASELLLGDGSEGYLLDDERVLRWLSNNERRARQRHVRTAFDWSDAKTSRVLCEMEQEGSITRFRSGREKIVCLPGRAGHGPHGGR